MSIMKPLTPRQSRRLSHEPWALRHRGELADTARFMTAMAVDDASQRKDPSAEHRVEIERTHYTSTGARYRVTYMGETLIESARDPHFEACRALLARGVKGMLVSYSPGSSVPRLRVDIEKGAKLMTVDNSHDGPRFGRYRPHPDGGRGDEGE